MKKNSILAIVMLLVCSIITSFSVLATEKSRNVEQEEYELNQRESIIANKDIMSYLKRNKDIPFAGRFIDEDGILNIGMAGNNYEKYIDTIKELSGDAKV